MQAAAWRGQVEAIRLFFDRGADVNAQGGRYGTALQAALVQPEYNDILKKLTIYGRDMYFWTMEQMSQPNVPDSVYGDCFKCCKNTMEA